MKIRGTGQITNVDFKAVKWVGKTKGNNKIQIDFEKAINMGNIEWQFADKDDTVSSIEFTAVYKEGGVNAPVTEPWILTIDDELTSGTGEIILGAGVLYVGEEPIALSRGGGSFKVEREYREIQADGDRGPVENRVVLDKSVAKLSMNVLTMLTRVKDLYAAVEEIEE